MNVDELTKSAVDEYGELITEISVCLNGGINVHIVGGLFKYFSPSGGTSRLLSYDGKEFPKFTFKDSVVLDFEAFLDMLKRFKSKGK